METYEEFINNILETRGRFECGDEYHERHHIIPKCMGGGNDEENLIDLFAREHFEAHRLLALENPENEKLVYAWWMMAHVKDGSQGRYELSPKEYEEAKIAFSKKITGRISPMKGKTPTEETRRKLSQSKKELYSNPKNHPMYGRNHSEETKNKLSVLQKGKHSGNKNPMYGKAGIYSPRYKPIYCPQLDRIFWGAKQVTEEFHIGGSSITSCCRHKSGFISAGKHPITKEKLQWYYVYDYTQKNGNIIKGAISLGYITENQVNEYLNNLKNIN